MSGRCHVRFVLPAPVAVRTEIILAHASVVSGIFTSPRLRSWLSDDFILGIDVHALAYREESSNNRIRSGNPTQKRPRPIDMVPGAGARSGTANGVETTAVGIAADDVEDPEMYPNRVRSRQSTASSHLSVEIPARTPSPAQGPVRRSSSNMTLTVDVGASGAPYLAGGGALVMSPTTLSPDVRSPVASSSSVPNLLSPATPNQPLPQLHVSEADA